MVKLKDETNLPVAKSGQVYISDFEDVLSNAVNVAQNKTIKEHSIQLRWDFHASAALKFEYLTQDNNQFSSTSYLHERVTPQAYRVGVDVVF